MKVSMSNALEGIEVTVSLTCAEPGDLPSGPALQLQSQPGGDEVEVSDRLLGTLNRALPGVLGEAVEQLRIAIAEMHLSRVSESRKAPSFAEAVKDFEGVTYESVRRPNTRIVLVCGPNRGESTEKERLCIEALINHFEASAYRWFPDGLPAENSLAQELLQSHLCLIRTPETIEQALMVLRTIRIFDHLETEQVLTTTYKAAMQELN